CASVRYSGYKYGPFDYW
nr:immunoglobulin heavy chain junction region [Macaca mulatta]MOX62205.1 immunoglobulin heavy chain junction region [Macaca mulatta]